MGRLIVEDYSSPSPGWATRRIDNVLLMQVLAPVTVRHCLDDGPVSSYALTAGTTVIPMRGVSESVTWSGTLRALTVQLADDAIVDAGGVACDIDARPGVNDPRLGGLLQALAEERRLGYPTGPLFVDAVEHALARVLVQGYGRTVVATEAHRGLHRAVLSRVTGMLRDRLAEPLSLKDMAACAGLGITAFCTRFRLATGQSPYQYLIGLRIEACRRLLKEERLSMLDVAIATGFATQQHMATVFRRHVGVTPSEFRERVR